MHKACALRVDEIPNDRRRRLLKNTSIGALASPATAQLPKHWQQPVVHSVILPAHAQASPDNTRPTATTVTGDQITVDFPMMPATSMTPGTAFIIGGGSQMRRVIRVGFGSLILTVDPVIDPGDIAGLSLSYDSSLAGDNPLMFENGTEVPAALVGGVPSLLPRPPGGYDMLSPSEQGNMLLN